MHQVLNLHMVIICINFLNIIFSCFKQNEKEVFRTNEKEILVTNLLELLFILTLHMIQYVLVFMIGLSSTIKSSKSELQ